MENCINLLAMKMHSEVLALLLEASNPQVEHWEGVKGSSLFSWFLERKNGKSRYRPPYPLGLQLSSLSPASDRHIVERVRETTTSRGD